MMVMVQLVSIMVQAQGVESGQSPSLEGEEGPVKRVEEQEWYGIGCCGVVLCWRSPLFGEEDDVMVAMVKKMW